MNVISTFDGMAVGYEALKSIGAKVDNYFASEIDKYAIQIARKNHPDIQQVGNVEQFHYIKGCFEIQRTSGSWISVPGNFKIDLLIGGSPCQGFSIAGNQLNFDDPRSKLFFEYVRLLKQVREVNPDVEFLLENVQMTEQSKNVISEQLGVEPIVINSTLVSAQHRKRFYWTNIKGVTLPRDLGITLKDILLNEVEEKYFISDACIQRLKNINARAKDRGLGYKNCILTGEDKFLNLDANFFKGPDGKRGVIRHHDGRLRMPTPLECERLQTLPDNYTSGVSDTQRYKMLGNGWTRDVIAHILSFGKFNNKQS